MFDFLRLTPHLLAVEEAAHGAGESGGHEPSIWGMFFWLIVALVIIFAIMADAKKGLNNKFFTRKTTQLAEQVYTFVENLCLGIIGPHGRRYLPFVFTLWTVIFVCNVVALFTAGSPTSDLSFNFGMALMCVGYVQWEGMRVNGVAGHFKHFAGPKLTGALILLTPLIFFIEIVSETMKNLSLSLRLFGNIEGGHKAVEAMNTLGKSVNIPIGAFLMPVKFLTCIVQALIFSLLFCVYLSLVTQPHDDHDHDDHAHDGDSTQPAAA